MTDRISPELSRVVEEAVAKALGQPVPKPAGPMEVGSPEWLDAPISPGSVLTNADAEGLSRMSSMSTAAQPGYMSGREHELMTIEGAAGGDFNEVVNRLEASPRFRRHVEHGEGHYIKVQRER